MEAQEGFHKGGSKMVVPEGGPQGVSNETRPPRIDVKGSPGRGFTKEGFHRWFSSGDSPRGSPSGFKYGGSHMGVPKGGPPYWVPKVKSQGNYHNGDPKGVSKGKPKGLPNLHA